MSLRALPSPLDGTGNNAAASGASLSPGLPGNATLATSTGSVASLNKSRTRNPYAAQPTPPNTLRPASTAQSPSGARPENGPGDAAADDIDVHSAASDGDDGGIDLPIAARPAKEEDDGVERSPGLRPGGKRTVQQALDRSAYSYSRMSPGISFNVNTDANPLEASDRAPFSGLRVAFPLSHARSQERVLPPPPAEAIGSTPPILRPDDGNRDDHTLVSDRDTRGTSTAHRDVDASEAKSAVESNVPASVQSEAPSLGGLSASALQDAIAGGTVDVACPPGFVLTVYNGDISQHFSIPSEHVQITRGAIKYVDHHARYGAQTRFRFQLCHNFLLRKCPKLSECSYIHATQLPAPTQVHLNPFAPRRLAADRHGRSNEVPYAEVDDPAVANSYGCMPQGAVFSIFPPHGVADDAAGPMQVPSELVIKTAGAVKLWGYMAEPAKAPPNFQPRHCAAYQLKRVCNLGATCRDLHSKSPYLGPNASVPPGATVVPQVGTVVIDPGRKPVPLEFEAESNGHVRAKARPGAKPRPPPSGTVRLQNPPASAGYGVNMQQPHMGVHAQPPNVFSPQSGFPQPHAHQGHQVPPSYGQAHQHQVAPGHHGMQHPQAHPSAMAPYLGGTPAGGQFPPAQGYQQVSSAFPVAQHAGYGQQQPPSQNYVSPPPMAPGMPHQQQLAQHAQPPHTHQQQLAHPPPAPSARQFDQQAGYRDYHAQYAMPPQHQHHQPMHQPAAHMMAGPYGANAAQPNVILGSYGSAPGR